MYTTVVQWALLPILGALIGWGTNVIAIRMLFRPRQPWRLPYTSFVLHGVIPRRQPQLAKAIADTVTGDLLPIDELIDKIDFQENQSTLLDYISDQMHERIKVNLGRFLPPPFSTIVTNKLAPHMQEIIKKEAGVILQGAVGPLKEIIQKELRVGEIIEQKVLQFDLVDLERIIYRVVGKELRHIELLGAVLGLLIGLLQALILTLIR